VSWSRAVIDRLSVVALLVGFAVPLVSRLHEPEMRSDESIYAYAVERVLDTGDWLTPRYIPSDGYFLEKPPLKIWVVAAAMRLGLVPRDDAGHRVFDGLFGAVGFLYVFLIARRLGGSGSALVAALTLFTMEALVYDHGLRSANMEAAVFLCYCGGAYHFIRWVEAAREHGRIHAWSVTAWFVLGFLTKFVAALFLPAVALLALAWRPGGLRLLYSRATEWVLPGLTALLVIAPWFIYESMAYGREFWSIIFGAHVYQRFTSFVDPLHLQPWHFYVGVTWREIAHAGSAVVVIGGLLRLGTLAWRGENWSARLTLVWLLLPFALISFGTSKLTHYAYPFWPPLAIGAGLFFTWALQGLDRSLGALGDRTVGRWVPRRVSAWANRSQTPRRLLISLAVGLGVLSAATAIFGPIRWDLGDTTLFRNSSILRPLFIAIVLVWIAGYSRSIMRLIAVTSLALLLPLSAYAHCLERLSYVDHPIREMRDCIREIRTQAEVPASGVLAASGDAYHHGYYFYLWREGPYTRTDAFSIDQALERLLVPSSQTPVLIARPDYKALLDRLPPSVHLDTAESTELRRVLVEHAVRFDNNVAALLPGPYAPCAARMIKAGAHVIW
jgi:4-amino-4-deoxy-L-arabinose transferase-like glycosyltransferase